MSRGRGGVLVVVVILVVLGVARARRNDTRSGQASQNCIVTAAGGKLCGDDAVAYCDRFPPSSQDAESIDACRTVGASVGTQTEQFSDPTPGDADGDGVPNARDPAPNDASIRSTHEPVRLTFGGELEQDLIAGHFYLVHPTSRSTLTLHGNVDPPGASLTVASATLGTQHVTVRGVTFTIRLVGLRSGNNVFKVRARAPGHRIGKARLSIPHH
jgi:hypothetical protein